PDDLHDIERLEVGKEGAFVPKRERYRQLARDNSPRGIAQCEHHAYGTAKWPEALRRGAPKVIRIAPFRIGREHRDHARTAPLEQFGKGSRLLRTSGSAHAMRSSGFTSRSSS